MPCTGRKSLEQRAVEQIDGERAAADIGAAHFVVARQHVRAADVVAAAMGSDRKFADGGGIAQAEIEALRADRRDDMRGFADQRDALAGEMPRSCHGKRKQAAPRLDIESCRGSNVKRVRSRRRVRRSSKAESSSACGWIEHPDQARAIARQRHQRERARSACEIRSTCRDADANASDKPSARPAGSCAHRFDAGGVAAHRTAAVGADHEPRLQCAAALERYGDSAAVGATLSTSSSIR